MFRIVLAAGILANAALASQAIEGRVLNAVTGAGVAGATVRIFPADGPPSNGHSTSTDSEGRFRLESFAEGAYRAMYAAVGFLPLPDPGEMPCPFTVGRGSEPMRLEVKLQPLAKISGRVLDAGGQPVPNAGIWLVRQEKWCMPPACHPYHRQAKSRENGEFTVIDLLPGPWLVAAAAPPSWNPPEARGGEQLAWAETFYPGVTDPELAEAVLLRPGGEQWNAEIKLAAAPTHRLRGRVVDAHREPASGASVTLGKGFGPVFTQVTKSDGTFEFTAVDDQWYLAAASEKGGTRLAAALPVELRKRDRENVELELAAPFPLRAAIVTETAEGAPAPPLPIVDAGLVADTGMMSEGPGGFLAVRSDGTVRDVYPGSYRLQLLTDSPAPYYLDSIRLGARDALGTVSLTSAAQPLTITYKLGGGSVRGTVDACGAAHVFLIPQEPALRRDGFIRIAACDRDGRFEFSAVRPGEYYGLALVKDPQSFTALADDRALGQAAKVTVRSNENTTAGIPLR